MFGCSLSVSHPGGTVLRMKRCGRCKRTLPTSSFHLDGSARDGLQGRCKECCAVVAKAANSEHYTRRRWGIPKDLWALLVETQGGGCGACGGPPTEGRAFNVDHDHETGVVRGLVCGQSNKIMGLANDDPVILDRMADYLGAWQSN